MYRQQANDRGRPTKLVQDKTAFILITKSTKNLKTKRNFATNFDKNYLFYGFYTVLKND